MVFQKSNLVTASLHVDIVAPAGRRPKNDKELMLNYAFANKKCY